MNVCLAYAKMYETFCVIFIDSSNHVQRFICTTEKHSTQRTSTHRLRGKCSAGKSQLYTTCVCFFYQSRPDIQLAEYYEIGPQSIQNSGSIVLCIKWQIRMKIGVYLTGEILSAR